MIERIPRSFSLVHTLKAMLNPFPVQQPTYGTRMHSTNGNFYSKWHYL